MPASPHFTLDLRTLHLVILLVGMVSAGALWLTGRRHAAMPGVRDWAWSTALMALGGLGISLRGIVWAPISIVAANACIIAGNALLWRGMNTFRGLPVHFGQVLFPTVLTVLFPSIALGLGPDWLSGRIVFTSIMVGGLELLIAHALLRPAAQPTTIVHRLMAALALVEAANHGTRILVTLAEAPTGDYLGGDLYQSLFILIALVLGIAKILGLLTLIGDRLQSELNRAASHDFLTQLPNRRAFTEQAGHEVARIARNGRPATLLLIDLDHFKDLNDSRGHATGDAALQAFSRLLVGCLRQHDLGCRYGGEEFCVLLPDTGHSEGHAVAERIRQAAEIMAAQGQGTTVSIGLTAIAPGQGLEDAINRADQALYAAKHAGRNRVEEAGMAVAGHGAPHQYSHSTPQQSHPISTP